jgi:hypothetical protein
MIIRPFFINFLVLVLKFVVFLQHQKQKFIETIFFMCFQIDFLAFGF